MPTFIIAPATLYLSSIYLPVFLTELHKLLKYKDFILFIFLTPASSPRTLNKCLLE